MKNEFEIYIREELKDLPIINVIYALSDPATNLVRYIGKAKNLHIRIKKHYKPSELKNKTHKNTWLNSLLSRNLRVKISILEECNSEELLNPLEKKWISYYKQNGYDLTNGTEEGDGGKMSPESIAKMIISKTGKKLSEKHKLKISEANTGCFVSEDTKRKIGKAHKNKIISLESIKKMSDAHKGQISWNKGKKATKETIEKQSKAHLGKKLSQETKDKIGKASIGNKYNLGHKDSLETKLKKSEAQKKRSKDTCKRGHTISDELKEKYSKLYFGKTWKIVDGKRVWVGENSI